MEFHPIDPKTLLSVLDRLPSLRELRLTNFALEYTLISQLCSNESFIRLDDCCSISSAGEFVQLIRSPKSLKRLGVEELRCSSQDERFYDSTPPPPVYSLAISGLRIPFMIDTADWLLSGSNRTAVRELRVNITSRVEARQAAKLLGKQGGALQRLEIVIDPESNLEVELYESGLSLTCLPDLRRCHLTFKLREMFVEGAPSLPWINSMVAQLCATCLEELVLCIQADNMEDLRLLDWETVSRTFEGTALQSLVVEGQGDASCLHAHIAGQWPQLGRLLKYRKVKASP